MPEINTQAIAAATQRNPLVQQMLARQARLAAFETNLVTEIAQVCVCGCGCVGCVDGLWL